MRPHAIVDKRPFVTGSSSVDFEYKLEWRGVTSGEPKFTWIRTDNKTSPTVQTLIRNYESTANLKAKPKPKHTNTIESSDEEVRHTQ